MLGDADAAFKNAGVKFCLHLAEQLYCVQQGPVFRAGHSIV